jgi:hypothetical protein
LNYVSFRNRGSHDRPSSLRASFASLLPHRASIEPRPSNVSGSKSAAAPVEHMLFKDVEKLDLYHRTAVGARPVPRPSKFGWIRLFEIYYNKQRMFHGLALLIVAGIKLQEIILAMEATRNKTPIPLRISIPAVIKTSNPHCRYYVFLSAPPSRAGTHPLRRLVLLFFDQLTRSWKSTLLFIF